MLKVSQAAVLGIGNYQLNLCSELLRLLRQMVFVTACSEVETQQLLDRQRQMINGARLGDADVAKSATAVSTDSLFFGSLMYARSETPHNEHDGPQMVWQPPSPDGTPDRGPQDDTKDPTRDSLFWLPDEVS